MKNELDNMSKQERDALEDYISDLKNVYKEHSKDSYIFILSLEE